MTALSHYTPGSAGTAGDGFRVPPPRKAACFRHHYWLASCPDCRDAHRPAPPATPEKASRA